jgi:ABC-type transport system substrate-binding protein
MTNDTGLTRRRMLQAAAIAPAAMAVPAAAANETVLRIAMTASDIPLTTGGPDNGFEGFRFIGYTLYDALINWDLSSADRPSVLTPGLATSWHVDPNDQTRWIFTLRPGVRFHDGSAFDADAVLWNLDKLLTAGTPQFDPKQAAQIRGRITSLKSWAKLDAMTVALTTTQPDSFFPFAMTFVLFSSPARFEALGRDWQRFASEPSGTGPWKLDKLVPRQRAELTRNPEYWDPARRPKIDRLLLLPVPETATRMAALLSGQVDWVEAPDPDQVQALKGAGMQLLTNIYPHAWTYMPSFLDGSPLADVRVRKAINLAIDRDGLTQLLGGLMIPAVGMVPPSSPWFGKPGFHIRHDPAEARRLLAEAGYTATKPLRFKIAISTSGSGQMQPLRMNEYIQQNLADVGVTLDLDVVEWETLLVRWRAGAAAPACAGESALNVSAGTFDPFNAFIRFYSGALAAPKGLNWGGFSNPEYDALIRKAQATFDPAARDAVLAELHARSVDDAVFIWVAHDVNPRALSPRVKGVVQAQSWYVDLSSATLA